MHTAAALGCMRLHQGLEIVQLYAFANWTLIGCWLFMVTMPAFGFLYALLCVVRMQRWMDANPDRIITVEEGAKKEGRLIVVGNAPLPDGVGSKIDQYDSVVRFNKYNKNVDRSGKKITHHFMSSCFAREHCS